METIKLTTYNQEKTETEEFENHVTIFEVSKNWLKRTVAKEFDLTLKQFMDCYIYDTAEIVYEIAEREGKVLSTKNELDCI